MTISPDVLAVYDCYSSLASLAEAEFSGTLGGTLLICGGLDPRLSQLILGASIAGGASLAIDSDELRIKDAIRKGTCEFMVNSLEEAIRILKNQIRKRQPVSVCLAAGLTSSLKEMLERGLQPDLVALAGCEGAEQSAAQFRERGARSFDPPCGRRAGELIDAVWMVEKTPGLWLPKIDALFESIAPGDPRVAWLRRAPLYLHRVLQFERFVRVSREEAAAFLSALAGGIRSGAIGVPVRIRMGQDEPLLLSPGSVA